MPRRVETESREVEAIVDAIVEGERVIEQWSSDMLPPPEFPRRELVQRLRALGPSVVAALRRRLQGQGPDHERAQVAQVIGELEQEQGALLVESLLAVARSGPWVLRNPSAAAVARFAPAQALAAGLHRVSELCEAVIRALGDRPEAAEAAVEALAIDDRLTKVRVLHGLNPRQLEDARVSSAVCAALRHPEWSVAQSAAAVVLGSPSEASLGAVIDAVAVQPALVSVRVARALRDHPRREAFVTAILGRLPGDLDEREEMMLEALGTVLEPGEAKPSWTSETRELLVERLTVCLARKLRPRQRPRGQNVQGRAIRASIHAADPRFIPVWIAELDEPAGFGAPMRQALQAALSEAGPPAMAALELFAASPPSESGARHARQLLAALRSERPRF